MKNADIEAAVEQSMVDELYDRAILSLPALVLVLLLLRGILGKIYDDTPSVQRCFAAVYVLIAARVVLTILGRHKIGPFVSVRFRHVAFGVGSTSVAMAWLVVQLLTFPHLDPAQLALFAICQAGTAAVALLSLGSSPILYLAYMLPSLLPMALFALVARPEMRTLPLMIVLFATILALMVLKEHKTRSDNVRLRLEVADMALRDVLTGLRNRRFVTEFMAIEAPRARRDKARPLVLMMIDLDHFKAVNDEHGHDAGDAVLVAVAELVTHALRAEDVVARWGGEEFVVVACETDEGPGASAGELLAERIRRRIADHVFTIPGHQLRSTCSIGWARFPFGELSWDRALALADAALYRAKRSGRDRCVGVLPSEGVVAPDGDLEIAAASGALKLVDCEPAPTESLRSASGRRRQASATH